MMASPLTVGDLKSELSRWSEDTPMTFYSPLREQEFRFTAIGRVSVRSSLSLGFDRIAQQPSFVRAEDSAGWINSKSRLQGTGEVAKHIMEISHVKRSVDFGTFVNVAQPAMERMKSNAVA
jgi:hypothetical protein